MLYNIQLVQDSNSTSSACANVRHRRNLRRVYPSKLLLRFLDEAQPRDMHETEVEPLLNGVAK